MSFLIRYYICGEEEKRIKELMDFCKKTNCKGVLFFTSSYDLSPSFLDIEKYKKYSEKLKKWMDIFKKEGYIVGINLLQTLGHIYFPKKLEEKFPFKRKVDINGKESKGGVCPFDKNFQNYIKQVYRIFAELKPDILYVDDDFRYIMDGIFCFCELHLERLEKKIGKRIDREELKKEILKDDFGILELRRIYFDVLNEGLKEVAQIIEKEVHSISPDTEIGLMTQSFPRCFWGCDLNEIIKILGGNYKGLCRPQIPLYSETGDLKYFLPNVFSNPVITKKLLSKNIIFQPEIECYPYSRFSKSLKILRYQMTICYLFSFDTLLLNIFDTLGSPLSYYSEFINMLEENKVFFEKVKEISKDKISKGVEIFYSNKSSLYRRVKEDIEDLFNKLNWESWLPLLGIPISHNNTNFEFGVITEDEILGIEKEKVKKIIEEGGVLIDGRALECLSYLGYSEEIGVEIEDLISIDDCGVIHFDNDELNENYKNTYWPLRFCVYKKEFLKLKIKSKKYKILSSIYNYEKKFISPSVIIIENEKGKRYGILNFTPSYNLARCFLNPKFQIQLRNLFNYIGKKELPVYILNHPFIQPLYFEGEKDIAILFLNLSNDDINQIDFVCPELLINPNRKIYSLFERGEFKQLDNEIILCGKIIKFRKFLSPFDFTILFFEK